MLGVGGVWSEVPAEVTRTAGEVVEVNIGLTSPVGGDIDPFGRVLSLSGWAACTASALAEFTSKRASVVLGRGFAAVLFGGLNASYGGIDTAGLGSSLGAGDGSTAGAVEALKRQR